MDNDQGGHAGGRETGPRCIAIVGPFGSGKTTLLEAMLARTGAIARQGSVDQGSTVGDSSPEARAHAMSVEANVASTDYLGDRYTFIDCPGSVEFLSEANGALAGADLAIVVAEADEKKLPALQIILKSLEDRSVPHFLFINKIDKFHGSLRTLLKAVQPASGVPLVVRQIPIWKSGIATGFIDLALERAYVYKEHATSEVIDIPDEEQAREVEARFEMLEQIADYDDVLMEQLLEDINPEQDLVFTDLVHELQLGEICPVFIGSAQNANGIWRLLKALRHEAPGIASTRRRLGLGADAQNGSRLQVLKTYYTAHGGKLSVARVLSGRIAEGDTVTKPDGSQARISGMSDLLGMHATKRGSAGPGETVALAKLEGVLTGETVTADTKPAENLIALDAAEPVIALKVAPRERKDEVKLSTALQRAAEEDPSLRVAHSQDTGETLLEGQGEMHLRVVLERLEGKYGISAEAGAPTLPYKETIRQQTSVRGRHKKQSGGHGQFGDVVVEIKPLSRGEGFVFTDTITGGVVPKQYIPSVREGIRDYLREGPLGFPVVDVAVNLSDGSFHSVDSSDQAFRTAGQIAMREGMPACKPVLLEPMCRVEIFCPNDTTARINAIVSGRRGQLLGFDARPGWDGWDVVNAIMPEAEMQDLIIELRSATAGVATFSKAFDHLAEVTGKQADMVLRKHGNQAA
ncbi:elongation factor G [Hoeflea prorocentri]|uniref:Elongation factor G n=1 Tax=Hoeflea prorocentri TaxID=1922333 RepID=A0A9X3ZHF7_9HYPH|nr:elongation factor G [Hoeflea prorocentri]MCY6381762.1 elongation factor G [Hoeflea prorocentri]MDA5399562.1 elongation factor G [Hoeflea prorocentri]